VVFTAQPNANAFIVQSSSSTSASGYKWWNIKEDGGYGRSGWGVENYLQACSSGGGGGGSVDYSQEVRIPDDIRNAGGTTPQGPRRLTYPRASTMEQLLGQPCPLTSDCTSVTSSSLKSKIRTASVGPFKVTGLGPAIDSLTRIFNRVRSEKPDVYNAVKTAGMLCCRAIRGSSKSWSNHSWGAAIDVYFGTGVDERGDGNTQRGLLELYPYFNAEGWYWAAGYSGSGEDAMHFEVAEETIKAWRNQGAI